MKDFKKLTMYNENIEITASDSTTPLLGLDNVIGWVAIENGLPEELETVWISNGKGWTTLGCIVFCRRWLALG